MLKSITLDNFMTYVRPTTFDFESKNHKFLEKENVGESKILKGALFVGENASGKTNALKAIRLLIIVLLANNEINLNWFKSFYSKKKDFTITYTFMQDGHEIIYGLTFEGSAITHENLLFDGSRIIARNGEKVVCINNKNELVKLSNKIPANAAFLRQYYFDTHFYGNKTLNRWYDFIKNSVYINCNDHRIESSADVSPNVTTGQYLEKNGVTEANNVFKEIGYKQDIIYEKTTPFSKTSGASFSTPEKSIAFRKDRTDVYIPLLFESMGNQTLIAILPALLHAVKNDCFIIVDEFSSGLHNELEESLIKYFFHYSNNSQIFLTSHSTNLLDNTIIRPDQIYSIRFDGENGSIIKRFSDEPIREAQNTEKMYLSGVFDNVPEYKKDFSDK